MRFLIDAQLPFLLREILIQKGFDAKHVLELPRKDLTEDEEIIQVADSEDRVVVTKDLDFYHSFMIRRKPNRLLIISTGNIKNKLLFDLFRANISRIKISFEECNLVEMSVNELIGHE